MPASKSKRKPTPNKSKTSGKTSPSLAFSTQHPDNRALEQREKAKHAQASIECLTMLGAAEGTMRQWALLHFRICSGLYVAQHYYEYSEELEATLSAGLDVLSCSLMRTPTNHQPIIMVDELDTVTESLNAVSMLMETLTLPEVKDANQKTLQYYDRLEDNNMKSYPFEALERIKMLRTLQEEKKQVDNNNSFKEAA